MGARLLRQPPTAGRTVLLTVTEGRWWTGPDADTYDRTQIQVPVRLGRDVVIDPTTDRVRSPRSLRQRLAIASFSLTGVIGYLIWRFATGEVH